MSAVKDEKGVPRENSIMRHPLWPLIEAMWDGERNAVSPGEITVGSHKTIGIICPRGHARSIRPPALLRALESGKSSLCIPCAKLPYTHPHLIPYYDEDKNTRPVGDVGPGSGDAWWRCDQGHSYEMKVYNRIKSPASHCPICRGVSHSMPKGELAITQHPELEPLYSPENTTPYGRITTKRALGVRWDFPCGHSYNSTVAQVAKHGGECIMLLHNLLVR